MYGESAVARVGSQVLLWAGHRYDALRDAIGVYDARQGLWQEWHNGFFRTLYRLGFAETAGERDSYVANKVDWKGFVEVPLTDAGKRSIQDDPVPETVLWDWFAEMLYGEYKVSWSSTNKGETIAVSLTCRNPRSQNAGYTMSAFAPDMMGAMRAIHYKHTVITGGDWTAAAGESSPSWG